METGATYLVPRCQPSYLGRPSVVPDRVCRSLWVTIATLATAGTAFMVGDYAGGLLKDRLQLCLEVQSSDMVVTTRSTQRSPEAGRVAERLGPCGRTFGLGRVHQHACRGC